MRTFLPFRIFLVVVAMLICLLLPAEASAKESILAEPARINAGEEIVFTIQGIPDKPTADTTYLFSVGPADGSDSWDSLTIETKKIDPGNFSGCMGPEVVARSTGARLATIDLTPDDSISPALKKNDMCTYKVRLITPTTYNCNPSPRPASPVCSVRLLVGNAVKASMDIEVLPAGSSATNPIELMHRSPRTYFLKKSPPDEVRMELEDLPLVAGAQYKLVLGDGKNVFSTITGTVPKTDKSGRQDCKFSADKLKEAWDASCDIYLEGNKKYIKFLYEIAVDKLNYNTRFPEFTYSVTPFKGNSQLAGEQTFLVAADESEINGEVGIILNPTVPRENQITEVRATAHECVSGGVNFTFWQNKTDTDDVIEYVNTCTRDCDPSVSFEGNPDTVNYSFPIDKSTTSVLIRAVCRAEVNGEYPQGFKAVPIQGDGEYIDIANKIPLDPEDKPIDDDTGLEIPTLNGTEDSIDIKVGALNPEWCYYITVNKLDGPILNPLSPTFAGNPPKVTYRPDGENEADCEEREYYAVFGKGGFGFYEYYHELIDKYPNVFALIDGADGATEATQKSIPMLPDGVYEIKLYNVGTSSIGAESEKSDDGLKAETKLIVGTGKLPAPPLPPCAVYYVVDEQTGARRELEIPNDKKKNPQLREQWLIDQGVDGCAKVATAFFPFSTEPQAFIQSVLVLLLSLSGGIALLIIIRSGYMVVASKGDPEKIQEARERLTSAIIGLLFLIFSLVILEVIGVDILRLPCFNDPNALECQPPITAEPRSG